jgi:hypothetical protein
VFSLVKRYIDTVLCAAGGFQSKLSSTFCTQGTTTVSNSHAADQGLIVSHAVVFSHEAAYYRPPKAARSPACFSALHRALAQPAQQQEKHQLLSSESQRI